MLFRTLHIGASGLRVAQAGLSTVGHNIANVDVEGYSRQRVELEANHAFAPGLPALVLRQRRTS
jgi:flagellar hook-associated protein 1 FlgK